MNNIRTIIITNAVELAKFYNRYHVISMKIVDGIGKDEQVVKVTFCDRDEED